MRRLTGEGDHGVLIIAPSLPALAAEGKVSAHIALQPRSAINSNFERLARGEVPSRVVTDFAV